MTDHFAEAESYLARLDTLDTSAAYIAVIAAQAHATLAQGQAAAEMVAMQKELVATIVPQSDATGALPTSPSPEVGVATSPPVPSPIEEPQEFGSVVRASSEAYEEQNWTPIPRTGDHWWHSETGQLEKWRDLIDPEVLRIGVGGDEKASLDEPMAYSNGYEAGAENARARITARLRDLRARLITFPEHEAIDKAFAEIKADVEDTKGGDRSPS